MELSRDPEDHFHIRATGKGIARVADIEISVLESADGSLAMTSFALAPGTEVPDPRPQTPAAMTRQRPGLRTAAALLLLMGAALSAVTAYASRFITVAGSDYRPILTQGAQWACVAFVLLQAAALAGKGWKLRLAALLGSLFVVIALLGVVARLAGLPRPL